MKDIQDFYILGLPIETPMGFCHFLKVKDYPDYFAHLQLIGMGKEQIIYDFKGGEDDKEKLRKVTLFQIVSSYEDLIQVYGELFKKVFNLESFDQPIEENEFNYYRSLIMKMNCVKEEKINPNPEIQKWIEKSKRFKQQGGDKLAFGDIVSSVSVFCGLSYEYINNMTIYQLYDAFHRIGNFKSYDTTTLFATVAEKVDIQNWCKHIDLFAEEEHGISREEFDKRVGGLFGGAK